MVQLNVRLSEAQLEGLRRYAARRRTPVAWLLRDYVNYLLRGGAPITPPDDDEDGLTVEALASIAARGGAFDWLYDEPDLYTASDGEAV